MSKESDLLEMIRIGIDAVRPSTIFPSLFEAAPFAELKTWLDSSQRLLLCIGKASIDAAESMLTMRECSDYFVIAPSNIFSTRLSAEKIHCGSHPVPDGSSVAAGRELLEWFEQLPRGYPLLVVLSGGASALMVAPIAGVSSASKFHVNDLLIRSGAAIHEINTVRKHLSAIKGGRLAAHLGGRVSCVLVISDVIGDDLATIGSGPFYPDPTTYLEAREILMRYNLWTQLSKDARQAIEDGVAGKIPETPKPGASSVPHHIVASNRIARLAAAAKATELGYRVQVIDEPVQGLVDPVAAALFKRIDPAPAGTAIVMGGETTVLVRGNGTGGRNQHLALLMAEKLAGRNAVFGAAGTDGIDGNSRAAGAWIDGGTFAKAASLDLNISHVIQNFDSFPFFRQLDQSILTGPTGTNVMDLYIALT